MVRRVVEGGLSVKEVAASFGVCERTVRKWVKRHGPSRSVGLAGLFLATGVESTPPAGRDDPDDL